MTGMSPEVWLNLQALYDSKILEIKSEMELDRQKAILAELDFKYFLKVTGSGAIRGAREKVAYLCSLLNISSLENLKVGITGSNFRFSSCARDEKNNVCARAWLYFAWKKASEAEIDTHFDRETLESHLGEIRSMSCQGVVASMPRLKEIFSECGIVFVPLPQLKNSKVNGVVKWFSNNKNVLLAINDRMKTEDSFWFTLFHEIKHVLQRKFGMCIVGTDEPPEQESGMEREADFFAMETLLPSEIYNRFVANGDFSYRSIRKISEEECIHPGIIAARLARDHHVEFKTVAKLRTSFAFDY